VLEKELVPQKVSELSAKRKAKATQGRASTLDLAKSVNAFQSRIKDVTRKTMVVVSELSVYQATAIKIDQDKLERDKEIQEADWRVGQQGTQQGGTVRVVPSSASSRSSS
jgi:hypothetical protein